MEQEMVSINLEKGIAGKTLRMCMGNHAWMISEALINLDKSKSISTINMDQYAKDFINSKRELLEKVDYNINCFNILAKEYAKAGGVDNLQFKYEEISKYISWRF